MNRSRYSANYVVGVVREYINSKSIAVTNPRRRGEKKKKEREGKSDCSGGRRENQQPPPPPPPFLCTRGGGMEFAVGTNQEATNKRRGGMKNTDKMRET